MTSPQVQARAATEENITAKSARLRGLIDATRIRPWFGNSSVYSNPPGTIAKIAIKFRKAGRAAYGPRKGSNPPERS